MSSSSGGALDSPYTFGDAVAPPRQVVMRLALREPPRLSVRVAVRSSTAMPPTAIPAAAAAMPIDTCTEAARAGVSTSVFCVLPRAPPVEVTDPPSEVTEPQMEATDPPLEVNAPGA